MSESPRRKIRNSSEHGDTSLEQRERANIRAKKWFKDNKDRRYSYVEKWNSQNKEQIKAYQRKYRQKLRREAFGAYCDGLVCCACCGEPEQRFLSIDHIGGEGNTHRKSINSSGGHNFYRWLKNNNYPSGYQVLCFNCNHARAIWGNCPHQTPSTLQIPL